MPTMVSMKQIMKARRSVEEIAADVKESMKDPEFRAIVKDFIKRTTS